jgi:hypothetical protein
MTYDILSRDAGPRPNILRSRNACLSDPSCPCRQSNADTLSYRQQGLCTFLVCIFPPKLKSTTELDMTRLPKRIVCAVFQLSSTLAVVLTFLLEIRTPSRSRPIPPQVSPQPPSRRSDSCRTTSSDKNPGVVDIDDHSRDGAMAGSLIWV